MNIIQPTLLVHRERALRNIRRMSEKAARSGVRFRPHFKTHQSAEMGERFREAGVECITVSSLDMAAYFAQNGWNDITVAFPVNILEIDKINQLGAKIRLNLLVESVEAVRFLTDHLTSPVNAWIKIDVGYHRTGIDWDDSENLRAVANSIDETERLTLGGLLAHSGHSYWVKGKQEIEKVYRETVRNMRRARDILHHSGFSQIDLSIGDTPTCSVVEDFRAVDEIRPGNFVFYDAMQWQIGACTEEDIAVGVACPVVAKHPGRHEMVIYGGAVHLSKDSLVSENGNAMYGYVCPLEENGWGASFPNTYVARLSQEHGVIRTTQTVLQHFREGDVLTVLPVHSCLAVNLMKKMYFTGQYRQ